MDVHINLVIGQELTSIIVSTLQEKEGMIGNVRPTIPSLFHLLTA
jgi:hypothetical protein